MPDALDLLLDGDHVYGDILAHARLPADVRVMAAHFWDFAFAWFSSMLTFVDPGTNAPLLTIDSSRTAPESRWPFRLRDAHDRLIALIQRPEDGAALITDLDATVRARLTEQPATETQSGALILWRPDGTPRVAIGLNGVQGRLLIVSLRADQSRRTT